MELKSGIDVLMRNVFSRAKACDEFQFAVAILSLTQGLPPHGPDNPLHETESFVRDMLGLMNAPLEYMTRIRLGLMVYVHMVESKPVYEELSNILWIIAGGRAIPEPFAHLYRLHKDGKRIPPSAKKVTEFIACQARVVGEAELNSL